MKNTAFPLVYYVIAFEPIVFIYQINKTLSPNVARENKVNPRLLKIK